MSVEFPIVATELTVAPTSVPGKKSPPYLAKYPSAVSITQGINQIPTATLQYPIQPNSPIKFGIRDNIDIGISLSGKDQNNIDTIFSGQITDVGYSVTPSSYTQNFTIKGYTDILRKLYAVQLKISDLSENAHGYQELVSFIQDGTALSITPTLNKNPQGLLFMGKNIIEDFVLAQSKNGSKVDPIEVIVQLILSLLEKSPFNIQATSAAKTIKQQFENKIKHAAYTTTILTDYFNAAAANNALFKQGAAVNPVSPILDFILQIFSTLNYNIIDVGTKILFVPELDWAEVPKCNVVFQDQILDMKVNFSFTDKPTRLRAMLASIPTKQNDSPFIPYTEGVMYYPNGIAAGDTKSSIHNYRKDSTGEEYRTGITPMSMKFGMAELSTLLKHGTAAADASIKQSFIGSDHVFASSMDSASIDKDLKPYFSSTSASNNIGSMMRSKFLAARASYSTAIVTTYLQPYIVPGLPMFVFGFFTPFIGIPVQVTHTIDSNSKQAITQITMSRCTNIVDPRISQPPFSAGLDVFSMYSDLGTTGSSIKDVTDIGRIAGLRDAAKTTNDLYSWERDYNRRQGLPQISIDLKDLLQNPSLNVYRL